MVFGSLSGYLHNTALITSLFSFHPVVLPPMPFLSPLLLLHLNVCVCKQSQWIRVRCNCSWAVSLSASSLFLLLSLPESYFLPFPISFLHCTPPSIWPSILVDATSYVVHFPTRVRHVFLILLPTRAINYTCFITSTFSLPFLFFSSLALQTSHSDLLCNFYCSALSFWCSHTQPVDSSIISLRNLQLLLLFRPVSGVHLVYEPLAISQSVREMNARISFFCGGRRLSDPLSLISLSKRKIKDKFNQKYANLLW